MNKTKLAVMAGMILGIFMVAFSALANTALVPEGTKFTHQKNVGGSYTITISGPVRIHDVAMYHHSGRRNTTLTADQIGGTVSAGPYLVTVSYWPGNGYVFNGEGFNFQLP